MRVPSSLTETEIQDSGLPRYEILQWRQKFGLVAGVTARREGLDFRLDQGAEFKPPRAMDLREGLGAHFRWLVIGRQEHTAKVSVHSRLDRTYTVIPRCDGHATKLRGTLLLATVADCVPVYLAHPPTSTIALLHAGWRGIAAGILGTGLEKFLKLASASPEECLMHCGISICGQCYEVGLEVFSALGLEPFGGRNVDLRMLLAQQALSLGLEAVTVSTWCTAHHGGRFYSHRAQGPRAGRMVAYLGLPDLCAEAPLSAPRLAS